MPKVTILQGFSLVNIIIFVFPILKSLAGVILEQGITLLLRPNYSATLLQNNNINPLLLLKQSLQRKIKVSDSYKSIPPK